MKRGGLAARGAVAAVCVLLLLVAPLVLGGPGGIPQLIAERFAPADLAPPPQVKLVSPRHGEGTNLALVIVGEARSGAANRPVADVQVRVDGGRWESVPEAPRGQSAVPFQLQVAVDPGEHVVEARATDGDGYSLVARAVVRSGIPAPPTTRILSPADGEGIVAGNVTVRGTAEGEGPLRILVGEPGQEVEAVALSEDARGVLWTATLSLSPGIRTIHARTIGAGGESLPATVALAAAAPLPPPSLTILSPVDGSGYGTAGSEACPSECVLFTGIATGPVPILGIEVSLDGETFRWLNESGDAQLAPGPATAWSWMLPTTAMFDGEHRASFRAVDASGATSVPRGVTFAMRSFRSLLVTGDDAPRPTGTLLAFEASSVGVTHARWTLDGKHLGNGTRIAFAIDEPGDHLLMAIATDDRGGSARGQLPLYAINRPPQASLAGAVGVATDPVRLTASGADPDGVVSTFLWSFGDNTSATTSKPQVDHRFGRSGVYTVTVIAFDDFGAASPAASALIPIANHQPLAAFALGPREATRLDEVRFEDLSDDPDGRIVTRSWSFGDGSEDVQGTSVGHRFAARGEHIVTLTVIDDEGSAATASEVVDIGNIPPLAAFSWFPLEPVTGQAIRFEDASRKPDGDVVGWAWDFGDGLQANGTPVSHAFAKPGRYDVRLVVLDDFGARSTVTIPLVVRDALPQISALRAEPPNPRAKDAVRFFAITYDREGGLVELRWDFGDNATSNATDPVHRYARSGVYTVRAIAVDAAGQQIEHNLTLVVSNAPPEAEIGKVDGLYAAFPTIVTAVGEDPDGRIVRYAFDLDGDGAPECAGESSECEYVYPGAGPYRLSLEVTDDEGATARVAQLVEVLPPPNGLAPPKVRIELPAPGTVLRGEAQAHGTAFGPRPLAIVEAQLRNESWTFSPGRGVWTAVRGSDEWFLLFDTRAMPDGAFQLVVRATDESGAVGESTVDIVIDNARPTSNVQLKVANLAEGAEIAGALTVTGTAWHPSGVTGVRWRVDDGAWRMAEGNNLKWAVPLDTRVLAPGEHTLQVDAYHGINERASLSLPFRVKDQTPLLLIDVPPGPAVYSIVHVEGRASPSARVLWRVDQDLWQDAEGAALWVVHANTSAWNGGSHRLSLKAVDRESGVESETITFPVRFLQGEIHETDQRTTRQTARETPAWGLALVALAAVAAAFARPRQRV